MSEMSSVSSTASKRLSGKVAIITGGAGGLGEATARLFVQHGAKVVIADVQDDKGISLCKEIDSSTPENNNTDNDGEITYVHCNVTDDTDVKSLIDFTVSKHGKIDIMFNNAGILGDWNSSILDSSNENFRNLFDTNVYGGFLGAKHAARVMIPNNRGVILFTASIASVVAGMGPHAYATSKHAIIGLMKNLCVELGQYGIRVNAISPGGTYTPLVCNGLGMDKERFDKVLCESNVLKRGIQEPCDVAHAALFLASDEARFLSGLNLIVDGGYTSTNPSFTLAFNKFMGS